MTIEFSRYIFVGQNIKIMKKKNEETLPEQGSGEMKAVEEKTTKEVVNNEAVNEEAAEEPQEEAGDDSPDDDEGGTVDIHASGKEFLTFLSKLLRMMKNIVELEKSLREFEKDPTFDMLMDLCMAHLEDMKESDKENESSEKEESEDDKESGCAEHDDYCDDDDNTVAEAFISMRVKKLKS